jgi:hypothetical protein
MATTPAMAVPAAQGDCPGAPPTRLVQGDKGVVTAGQANNLRDRPTKAGELVGKLDAGTVFDVWDGPTCAEGLNWWRVRTADLFGWTPEGSGSDYWLEPYVPETVSRIDQELMVVDYQGTHFAFDPSLASSVTSEILVESPSPMMTVYPQGTQFRLLDYPGAHEQDHPAGARIEVYPADGFDKLGVGDDVDHLRALLAEQPDTPKEIPVPAVGGAAQIFTVQVKYLDLSAGGTGVRFISEYAQDMEVVTNRTVFYMFVGLTDSGYYLLAILPADTAALPDDVDASTFDYNEFADNYQTYLHKTLDTLNALRDSDFTPNLALLDALVQSIEVKG